MITVNGFPQLDTIRYTDRTVIVPGSPGRSEEILAIATKTLAAEGNDLINPRVIPIRGEAGLGFDLVCFTMQKRPVDPEAPAEGAKPPLMLMAFLAEGDSPYTGSLGSVILDRTKGQALDLSAGYPVFVPSAPADHLATQYHGCPTSTRPRRVAVVTMMPAAGNSLCTIQDQSFRHLARITLKESGRKVHMVALPPESTSLRVVFESPANSPTPLPTQIRLYEIPE